MEYSDQLGVALQKATLLKQILITNGIWSFQKNLPTQSRKVQTQTNNLQDRDSNLETQMVIPVRIAKISTEKLGFFTLFLRNPFAIKLPIPNKTKARNRRDCASIIVLLNEKVSKLMVGKYSIRFGNIFFVSNR